MVKFPSFLPVIVCNVILSYVILAQMCSEIGTVNGCNSEDDITSFDSIDAIFEAESQTTSRQMLMGHRCALSRGLGGGYSLRKILDSLESMPVSC